MAKIESIHRQQRRISGYLEVSLQQILRYAASIRRVRHEIIRVKLILIVSCRHGAGVHGSEVIASIHVRIAQHAITVGRIIERAR